MPYSTIDDFTGRITETELIALTDEAGAGEVDTTAVSKAIADADEEIDGYLGTRLPLPLSTVPSILKKYSVDIAIYNLYTLRQDSIPDIRRDRYKNAIAFLAKVAEGKISLGASDPAGAPPSTGIAYTANDQVMTAEKLGRF